MGFVGPEQDGLSTSSGSTLDARGNVARDATTPPVPGVFVAGDMRPGPVADRLGDRRGRACAAGVDEYLSGSTKLPKPILPTERSLTV